MKNWAFVYMKKHLLPGHSIVFVLGSWQRAKNGYHYCDMLSIAITVLLSKQLWFGVLTGVPDPKVFRPLFLIRIRNYLYESGSSKNHKKNLENNKFSFETS
jgi:hypothetical protein